MSHEGVTLRRRVADQYKEGQNFPDEMAAAKVERDGITNRIVHALPGSDIVLREGTTAIMYHRIKNITWGDVFFLLVQAGVLEDSSGNSVWRKRKAAQNTTEPNDIGDSAVTPLNIKKIVNKSDSEMLKNLDIGKPEERRLLMKIILARGIRNSVLTHGAHDFSDLLELLTDAAIQSVPVAEENSSMHQQKNYLRRCEALMMVIENYSMASQGVDLSGNNKKKRIQHMVSLWARDIELAIMKFS